MQALPHNPASAAELAASLAALAALALLLTILFRLIRLPGGRPTAAILGGICAGLLLGQPILGSLDQPLYHRLYAGAPLQRSALDQLARSHEADLRVLTETGVTAEALDELRLQHEPELARARADLARAAHADRAHLHLAAITLAALAVFIAAWAARSPPHARRATAHAIFSTPHAHHPHRPPRDELLGVLAAAAGCAFFAGVPTYLILTRLLDSPHAPALAFAAAVVAGSAFTGLPMRRIAQYARTHDAPLVRVFGLCVLLIALAAALIAHPASAPWLLGPAAAGALGAMLRLAAPSTRAARRLAVAVLCLLLIPTLAAIIAVQLEWSLLAGAWWLIAFLVFTACVAGDGHILGSALLLGAAGSPRQRAHTLPFWVESHAQGFSFTMLCFAAALLAAGLINPSTALGTAAAAALLINALVPELLLPINRRFLTTAD